MLTLSVCPWVSPKYLPIRTDRMKWAVLCKCQLAANYKAWYFHILYCNNHHIFPPFVYVFGLTIDSPSDANSGSKYTQSWSYLSSYRTHTLTEGGSEGGGSGLVVRGSHVALEALLTNGRTHKRTLKSRSIDLVQRFLMALIRNEMPLISPLSAAEATAKKHLNRIGIHAYIYIYFKYAYACTYVCLCISYLPYTMPST